MEERMRKFASVVEQDGFSKAATYLHISQPALTTAVKKLERELEAKLLERRGKTITLTDAGKIVYTATKKLADNTQNLRAEIARLTRKKPVIKIGMIDSIAGLLFDDTSSFNDMSKKTHTTLVIDNSRQLISSVLSGKLDLAIVTKPPSEVSKELAIKLIGNEQLLLVTHHTNKRYYESNLTRKSISNFLSYNTGSFTHKLIAEFLEVQGLAIDVTFQSTSPEIMLRILLSGHGAAILPRTIVQTQIDNSQLCILTFSGSLQHLDRPLYQIHRKDRILANAIQKILSHTTQKLAQANN